MGKHATKAGENIFTQARYNPKSFLKYEGMKLLVEK